MPKEIQPTVKPWKYEDSVEIGKRLVGMHRKVMLDLVRELYAARQALSAHGKRTDNPSKVYRSIETTSGQNDRKLSPWEQYCHDIGLSKMTALRYLSTYFPEEDRLLTEDEIKARKEEARLKLIEMFKEVRSQVGDVNRRPEGWTPSIEAKYQE